MLSAEAALRDYGTGRAIDKAGAESHYNAALIGGVEYLGEFSEFDTQNVICSSAVSGANHPTVAEAGNEVSDPLGQQV